MKKSTKSTLSILLTLIIIFSPTLLLSFKAEAYVGLGDANYDGWIDDWDVDAILGLSTGINCERPDLADVNRDSKVNSVDAKILSLAYGGYFPIDVVDYANLDYSSAYIPTDGNASFSLNEVYNDGTKIIVDINLDSGGFYSLDIKFNTMGLKFNSIKTYGLTESPVAYNSSATEGYNHISAISSNGAFVSVGEPILPTDGTGLFATIEFEITATNYSYEAEVFECGKLVQTLASANSGYNFETDKYSFGNYSAKIEKSFYQNLFGKIIGSAIYSVKKDCSTGGVCYGMALSTSAILQDMPPVSWLGADYLSEIGQYSFNGFMTADNFIRYAYIYQFGAKNTLNECNFINRGIKVVGQQVSSALESNKYILITFNGGNKNSEHAVLAVDKTGEDIYVNDSNEWNKLCMINVEGDYWEYSAGGFSWNSNNAKIWTTDLTNEFIKGMQDAGLYKLTDDLGDELTYLESTYNLAVISNGATFENNDQFYLVSSYASGVEPTENTSNNQLYWTESNSLSVTDVTEDNSDISLMNTDTAVKTNLSKDSEATITLDNTSADVNISSKENDAYDILISTTDENNEIIDMTVSGTANGEEIAVSRTDNSIEVSGLNDVNATLKVDENTEKKTTFNVDNGDKLTLDFDNENNEIKTDKEFLITVSENNSYRVGDVANLDVAVVGNPTKIRFIDSENNSITYTPDSKNVHTITDNGDGTVTWNLDINVLNEKETYSVYAKFEETGWNIESGIVTLTAQPFDASYHSTEFEVISDGVIYNGVNTMTVKTGLDVSKVQLYKNGNTWTYTADNATIAEENGVKVWTIKMNFSQLGDQTYNVRTRSKKTAFEIVDTLNLTVYSK